MEWSGGFILLSCSFFWGVWWGVFWFRKGFGIVKIMGGGCCWVSMRDRFWFWWGGGVLFFGVCFFIVKKMGGGYCWVLFGGRGWF